MILISEEELRELLEAAHTYWALEQGGVDNWEWCWESVKCYLELYPGCEEIEDIVEETIKEYRKESTKWKE